MDSKLIHEEGGEKTFALRWGVQLSGRLGRLDHYRRPGELRHERSRATGGRPGHGRISRQGTGRTSYSGR